MNGYYRRKINELISELRNTEIIYYRNQLEIHVFTFKFFTLISALPNNINSTVKYIYTCQYPISYKSINLQIINSSLSVCIHRYMYDMYLPYRTKSYFLYNIVCLCYIMFLKLLRILLNVCSPKYHSLYMNYFLYNHATCPLTVSMMYMDTCFTTYYHSIKTMHPDSFNPQANSNIYI